MSYQALFTTIAVLHVYTESWNPESSAFGHMFVRNWMKSENFLRFLGVAYALPSGIVAVPWEPSCISASISSHMENTCSDSKILWTKTCPLMFANWIFSHMQVSEICKKEVHILDKGLELLPELWRKTIPVSIMTSSGLLPILHQDLF